MVEMVIMGEEKSPSNIKLVEEAKKEDGLR